jgi:hypothetical protein
MFKMISLLILVYIIIIYQLLKVIFSLSSIIYIKVSEYHFSNKAVELQIPNIIVQQPGGWEMTLGWGGGGGGVCARFPHIIWIKSPAFPWTMDSLRSADHTPWIIC